MSFLNVIEILGGLAFFLYGMHVMSSGLEKMSGGKLEAALKKMTSNPGKALLLGAGITVAIQSSSALTVMLVGLVNSGIMTLNQTIGVIMGSNIGTTFTAWLLSLMGIQGNIWVSLLNPKYFSLIFALIGVFFILGGKSVKKKDIGAILVCFAVLMYGMKMMGDAVEPLADSPKFGSVLLAFKNPIFGVIIGAVVTGIVQSSAASVGILQTLAMKTGAISYSMAIPIIMGQNIGTCVTALISSIGVGRNAKKVSIVHISFNIIGTIVCLTLYLMLDATMHFSFSNKNIDAAGIALVHTIFNVTTTFMLFPFTKLLEKIANFCLPDEEDEEDSVFIDKRLLATPSVAIAECDFASAKMAHVAKETILLCTTLLDEYDEDLVAKIRKNEDELDDFEDKIGTTLVKLSSSALSEKDSQITTRVLRAIGDFERLGDHAMNLVDIAREINQKKINFSDEAKRELKVLTDAITEIMCSACRVYEKTDVLDATTIEPLEQVIDRLTYIIKANHIERLRNKQCTIEGGFILSDLLSNYERISDHCSNIAVSIIETSKNMFDTHDYLHKIKHGNNKKFTEMYDLYAEKYEIK
ncbi:MAG: Na/Pi cotransporter family protein [Alphaproteobacteria bacterium]|nr:Na/Pi cotransporter family protein [Alphaproteobacteria bacterium]